MADTDPPDPEEREIIAELMMSTGALIGTVDQIWTHPSSGRALVTMRRAIRAIDHLVRLGRALGATRVKMAITALAEEGDEEYPFMLDETVKHLLEDGHARTYWDMLMPTKDYPHVCPRCGHACFIGFLQIDCKKCGEF